MYQHKRIIKVIACTVYADVKETVILSKLDIHENIRGITAKRVLKKAYNQIDLPLKLNLFQGSVPSDLPMKESLTALWPEWQEWTNCNAR